MNTRMKLLATAAIGIAAVITLAGCSKADTVSQNLSKEADNFQVERQIVFHDDITDTYIAEVDGLCSLGNSDSGGERTVTCKIGNNTYVKEIFQMGDNTSISSVQTKPLKEDPYAYKVIFKPTTIDFDLQTPSHNAGGN